MSKSVLDWNNLENSSIQALKYACQQLQIRPAGPLKKHYVGALRTYRATLPPSLAHADNLDLEVRASFRNPDTGVARPEERAEISRTKNSDPMAEKVFSSAESLKPTQPRPAKTGHSFPPPRKSQIVHFESDDDVPPKRESLPPARSVGRGRSPSPRPANGGGNLEMYLDLVKYAAVLGGIIILVVIIVISS
jgi:hypothetical protein